MNSSSNISLMTLELENCTEKHLINSSLYDLTTIDERYGTEYNQKLFPIGYYFSVYLIPIWLVIGLIGNFLAFFIWISPRQRKKYSSAIYLAALALSDLIFICLHFDYYFTFYHAYSSVVQHIATCKLYHFLNTFVQFYSILLVFGFTLERWIAIWFPFERHRLCTSRRALMAVTVLGGFATVPAIAQAVFFNIFEGQCQPHAEMKHFRSWFIPAQEAIFSLIVPLAAMVFNIMVLKEMKRLNTGSKTTGLHSQNGPHGNGEGIDRVKESSSFLAATLMVVILSFYLILCALPPGVAYMLQLSAPFTEDCLTEEAVEENADWQIVKRLVNSKMIIDTLCMSHYACNFFIYFSTSKSFREQTMQMLICSRSRDTKTVTNPSSRRASCSYGKPFGESQGMQSGKQTISVFTENTTASIGKISARDRFIRLFTSRKAATTITNGKEFPLPRERRKKELLFTTKVKDYSKVAAKTQNRRVCNTEKLFQNRAIDSADMSLMFCSEKT
ncbi:unnamed protein product [Protopolystoma xenopodis]|uniref:G-protein coupled receptors family 1 profile domain-containing protein n=1 Tax=Protopolystoma xenopodis TaxID=117903 RepID=A0A3S5CQD3_9PLAT|nr:unnamed protein product [Protopolystoma xenopodis]